MLDIFVYLGFYFLYFCFLFKYKLISMCCFYFICLLWPRVIFKGFLSCLLLKCNLLKVILIGIISSIVSINFNYGRIMFLHVYLYITLRSFRIKQKIVKET